MIPDRARQTPPFGTPGDAFQPLRQSEQIVSELLKQTEFATGLIFDCDGTLADTMPLHDASWRKTFAEYGLSVTPEEFNRHRGRLPLDFIRELVQRKNWSFDPAAFVAKKEAYYRATLDQIKPIEPVVQVARVLAGSLPMAVASGGTAEHVKFTLRVLGLLDAFKVVLSGDDPVTPKPSPAIFLEAARRLGIDPKGCVVFEDADSGIEAASAAGMRAVDVRTYLSQPDPASGNC